MPLVKPKIPPQKVDWLGNPVCPRCGEGMQKLCGRDYCEHCKHEVPWPKAPKRKWLGSLICWIRGWHKTPLRKLDKRFVQCLRCGEVFIPGIHPVDPWPLMPPPPPPVSRSDHDNERTELGRYEVEPIPGPPPPPSTKERIQAVSDDIERVHKQIAKLAQQKIDLSIRLKELKGED